MYPLKYPAAFSRVNPSKVSLHHLAGYRIPSSFQVYPWESIPSSFSRCIHESIPLSFSRCIHGKVSLYHLAGVSMGKYCTLSFSRCIDGKVSLYHFTGNPWESNKFIIQQVYPWEGNLSFWVFQKSIPLSFSRRIHGKCMPFIIQLGLSMGKYPFIISSRCIHKVSLYHLAGVSMGKYPFIIYTSKIQRSNLSLAGVSMGKYPFIIY